MATDFEKDRERFTKLVMAVRDCLHEGHESGDEALAVLATVAGTVIHEIAFANLSHNTIVTILGTVRMRNLKHLFFDHVELALDTALKARLRPSTPGQEH